MSYIPHTDSERKAMLAAIGVNHMEELFNEIPEQQRFPELNLPAALSEPELEQELAELAEINTPVKRGASFLGAGAYRHYIPATVDDVLRRSEFYTSYTPYQPEASQGMLQATFEYQSMICRLTGMEVSNASHYDGASALAEAVLLALAATPSKRHKIILPDTIHPQYRAVVSAYLRGTEAVICDADEQLHSLLTDDTAALVIQNPNFFGQFENTDGLAAAVHEAGALLIVVPDPIALGLFQAPGDYGADLVAAEGQSLGISLSFGGPHLGILACRRTFVRKLSGRLVGETVDAAGKRAYVLTLSTREQHIRREKATSNICTNAALSALAAAVYLATLGKSGLQQIARLCYHKAHYAATQISAIKNVTINPQAPEQPFFKEFVVRLPRPVAEVNQYLLEQFNIMGGYDLGRDYPQLDRHILIAVTEMNNKADIDRLVQALKGFTHD